MNLYDLHGATLHFIERNQCSGYTLHLKDTRGRWHIFETKEKGNKMKSGMIYLGALLIVAVGVALATGVI